jgi:hypothetical protein
MFNSFLYVYRRVYDLPDPPNFHPSSSTQGHFGMMRSVMSAVPVLPVRRFQGVRGCIQLRCGGWVPKGTLILKLSQISPIINYIIYLVGGFNHLENMKVNGKDYQGYPIYYGKQIMFETTNRYIIYLTQIQHNWSAICPSEASHQTKAVGYPETPGCEVLRCFCLNNTNLTWPHLLVIISYNIPLSCIFITHHNYASYLCIILDKLTSIFKGTQLAKSLESGFHGDIPSWMVYFMDKPHDLGNLHIGCYWCLLDLLWEIINDNVSVLPYPPALGLTTAEGQNSNITCELTVQTLTE